MFEKDMVKIWALSKAKYLIPRIKGQLTFYKYCYHLKYLKMLGVLRFKRKKKTAHELMFLLFGVSVLHSQVLCQKYIVCYLSLGIFCQFMVLVTIWNHEYHLLQKILKYLVLLLAPIWEFQISYVDWHVDQYIPFGRAVPFINL